MKIFYFFIFVCLLPFSRIFCQPEADIKLVKYTHDFRFTDGIFMSFEEFKNNAPSIRKFEYIENKNSREKGNYTIRYIDTDSTGNSKTRAARRCFGFSRNGVFYFNNGSSGYYRMFIIGALSHILWYTKYTSLYGDYAADGLMIASTVHEFKEYLLDFETGEKFKFTYKKFKDFLKTHDEELLNELEKSKNKREMIHYFLLKYNEKHPIYIPLR
jgi:hypothetical protein